MWEPHVAGRHFSGSDSGTASSRKPTSRTATNDASAITRLSLYARPRYAPIAGLVTRLAANDADTWICITHRTTNAQQVHVSLEHRRREQQQQQHLVKPRTTEEETHSWIKNTFILYLLPWYWHCIKGATSLGSPVHWWVKSKKRFVDRRIYGRIHGRTFETNFIRSTLSEST